MKHLIPLIAASVLTAVPALAADGCLVEEAAQAALQRQIELIQATAADPEDSFSGVAACINSDILSAFDLSIAIPDLAGLMTSIATDAITDAINSAKTQACRAIQDAVSDTVGNAQATVTSFNSSLTDELEGVLDNGWGDLDFEGSL
tara:strand:+ start:7448 stop:7888 length:441 start_codon:yes stop_codon:yes gene_type:complete